MKLRNTFLLVLLLIVYVPVTFAQKGINWSEDGLYYTKVKDGNIVKIDPKTESETVIVKKEQLTPAGASKALWPQSYAYSSDKTKLLIFTNTAKVWRYKTRGDYWVLNLANSELHQVGKSAPSQSLMFAKFSPDGKQVAYVSEHNLFSEDVSSGVARKLTLDGTRKMINGTFDWVYEEEFGCRDGFRWSPDSKRIAFWQVDATRIRDYYMLNTTDSVYSRVIPVEYPKTGDAPSPVKIGVVSLSNQVIRWMKIEGDPQQNYLPRMEWSGTDELVVQQLDRRQQESKLIYCNATDGNSRTFWAENDEAWVDLNVAEPSGDPSGWTWINNGQDFLWVSEKDGWRHIYKISRDGKSVTLLTKGNYDIGAIRGIDETNNYIYFTASPSNATQLYLYRVRINNPSKQFKEEAELVSNAKLKGTHNYDISPRAKYAFHSFSNHNTAMVAEWISLPENKPLNSSKSIMNMVKTDPAINVEYMQVVTEDNIILDAWMNKPKNFDATKKYPIVFYVYGEPATTTTDDVYGNHDNFLYGGDMSTDGYIQVALDNRGTPALKGAAWRKAIYRKNGTINIRDMAMGAKKIIESNNFIDKDRVAVWGWSGGGSSTLNLLFQYPDIFKTGVSIAPVTNLLYYDNIYTERYMGLPQENMESYINGSPVTHAKNLKGNLLLIHGSGDDNVHFSNAEALVNELVKYNKQFEFMEYPNRTHSINEGPGTSKHLQTLYTNFIKKNCPPGAK
ncbi:MAG: DPP IV N-terminal domain-containing protein [Bacteroidetes bacterium]|nr:DPP IV N-terminal domain-containing protein [Bacteroidota bacterium]